MNIHRKESICLDFYEMEMGKIDLYSYLNRRSFKIRFSLAYSFFIQCLLSVLFIIIRYDDILISMIYTKTVTRSLSLRRVPVRCDLW